MRFLAACPGSYPKPSANSMLATTYGMCFYIHGENAWNVRKFTLDSPFFVRAHTLFSFFSKQLTRKTPLAYFSRQICLSENSHFPCFFGNFRFLSGRSQIPPTQHLPPSLHVNFRLRMQTGIAAQIDVDATPLRVTAPHRSYGETGVCPPWSAPRTAGGYPGKRAPRRRDRSFGVS